MDPQSFRYDRQTIDKHARLDKGNAADSVALKSKGDLPQSVWLSFLLASCMVDRVSSGQSLWSSGVRRGVRSSSTLERREENSIFRRCRKNEASQLKQSFYDSCLMWPAIPSPLMSACKMKIDVCYAKFRRTDVKFMQLVAQSLYHFADRNFRLNLLWYPVWMGVMFSAFADFQGSCLPSKICENLLSRFCSVHRKVGQTS